MRTFALIFTCFAGMFAFGFLLAGYAALLSLDVSEVRELGRREEERRFRGLFGEIQRWIWQRSEVLPVRQIVDHWRARPDVRRAIWLGLGFLVAALVSGSALQIL